MVGGSDPGDRVQEFLDWAQASGVDPVKLPQYRNIGTDLFARAKGLKVNESHILAVADSVATQQDAEKLMRMTEEVGDAVLRFQDWQRGGGKLSAERITKPPIQDRPTVEMPPPVTFTTPPSTGLPPTPPTPAHARVKRKSIPPLAAQFRCPRCKVMVRPASSGRCPHCGGEPPHTIAVPNVDDTAGRARRLRVLLAVLLAVVAVFAVTRLKSRVREGRAAGIPVSEWRSVDLEASFTFGPGWRHLPDDTTLEDPGASEVVIGASPLAFDPRVLAPTGLKPLHLAGFYLGNSPPRENARAILGYGRADDLRWRASFDPPEDRLVAGAGYLARGVVPPDAAVTCDQILLPFVAGRCEAAVTTGHVVSYFWEMKQGYAIALLHYRAAPSTARAAGDSLVASVRPE